MIFKQTKFNDFRAFKVGDQVAVPGYGGYYSIGTITKIEPKGDGLRMEVRLISYYDSYKPSKGIQPHDGLMGLDEYHTYRVITQDELLNRIKAGRA